MFGVNLLHKIYSSFHGKHWESRSNLAHWESDAGNYINLLRIGEILKKKWINKNCELSQQNHCKL